MRYSAAVSASIGVRELRNHISDVLRRVESGERIMISVSGRPVAELRPLAGPAWSSKADILAALKVQADSGLTQQLDEIAGDLLEPLE